MRLHFLLAAMLSVALPVQAELLISEYIEGSPNNKTIEAYNLDGAEADLSVHKIEQYNNGANTPATSLTFSDKLAPDAVHMMAHSTLASVLDSRVSRTAMSSFNGGGTPTLTRSGMVINRID